MKPKALMLLAVAIGCGLIAMLGVQQAMQGSQKEVVIETRKVLMAIKDLHAGDRLNEVNVALQEVPVTTLASLKEDVVMKPEEFEERAITISVMAGDPIRKSKLSEKGQYSASSMIPKGMRVFTFPATDTHTHSGLLRAGDHVDVTVTFQSRNGSTTTKVLLECIEVFATENKTTASEDSKNEQRARNVSLLVTPEQDSFVKVAQARGQLSLSLRHPEDDEVNNINGINSTVMEDLQRSIGNDDVPGYAQNRFADEDEPAAAAAPTPVASILDPVPAPVAPGASTPAEPGNVQSFLQPGAVAPANTPKHKTWTMKVYSGNESLEIPLDDVQAEMEAASTGSGIPGLLKSLWSSDQK